MNQLPEALQVVYAILLLVGWVGAAVFPIAYGMTMRFWESEMGMHFFFYGVAIWLALTPSALFVIFGDFPGRGFLNLFTFALTVFVIIWRDVIFLKILFGKEKQEDLTPLQSEERE